MLTTVVSEQRTSVVIFLGVFKWGFFFWSDVPQDVLLTWNNSASPAVLLQMSLIWILGALQFLATACIKKAKKKEAKPDPVSVPMGIFTSGRLCLLKSKDVSSSRKAAALPKRPRARHRIFPRSGSFGFERSAVLCISKHDTVLSARD